MALSDKNEIAATLKTLNDSDDFYEWLIKLGKEVPDLTSEQKIEKYRITGCTSQLWLLPELKAGQVIFHIDSDASIPKGLGAIMARIYSNCTPEEALKIDVSDLGIQELVSMNRRNGVSNLQKQILLYSAVFQQLAKTGLKDHQI